MSRILKLALAVMGAAVFMQATCGKAKPGEVTPVLKMTITDHVPFHNMGIAFDGSHYFTINGGNADNSVVNEYDKSGKFVESYDFGVDGRAIGYDAGQDRVYVKGFGEDLLGADFDLESADTEQEGLFAGEQSSVGFSSDGALIYELDDGEVHVYDADEGEETNSFDIENYSEEESSGYSYAIAASDKFLFVWKNETDVYVYDLAGKYVTSFELPRAGFGFSLSYCNGMLWTATDADGSTEGADGKWYGYQLKGLE